jgi:hypothetical protein
MRERVTIGSVMSAELWWRDDEPRHLEVDMRGASVQPL